MDQAAFDRVHDSFTTFHAHFAPWFGRKEAQQLSERYLRGLLVQHAERRNAENLAEAVGGVNPRALQRLLTDAPWKHEPVIDALHAFLAPRLNAPDGVWIVDDTGFAKQGRKSVGVARQYSGTLGKVGNCQIGVGLTYASPRGHTLVDMGLYLPERWTEDRDRCRAAGVPDEVGYQSKAELGLALLRAARKRGHLTAPWVTADEGYGQVPSFRDTLDVEGWWYVVEVPCTTRVFVEEAVAAVPVWKGRGKQPTRARLLAGEPAPLPVREVATGLSGAAWHTGTVADGAQGPRTYQFAVLRGWEARDGVPGRECWVVLRRNLDGSELKYMLSNAPATTCAWTLGRVGATRWSVETDSQTHKGAIGLDEYEVRSWRGWYHHMTLSLLAGAFLVQLHQEWGKKDAATHAAAGQPHIAGTLAQAAVDDQRVAALAGGDPNAQRTGQTVSYQPTTSRRTVYKGRSASVIK
jgi:SRSO17 transposase